MSRKEYTTDFEAEIVKALNASTPTPPRQSCLDVTLQALSGSDESVAPTSALEFVINLLQAPEWPAVLRALLILHHSIAWIREELCREIAQIPVGSISDLQPLYQEVAEAYLNYVKAKAYNHSRKEFILLTPQSSRLDAITRMSPIGLEKETTLCLSLLYYLIKPGPALNKVIDADLEILNRIAYVLLKDSEDLLRTIEQQLERLSRLDIEERKLFYILENFEKCFKMLAQLYDLANQTEELLRPRLSQSIEEIITTFKLKKERANTPRASTGHLPLNFQNMQRSYSIGAFHTAPPQHPMNYMMPQASMMYQAAYNSQMVPTQMFTQQSNSTMNQGQPVPFGQNFYAGGQYSDRFDALKNLEPAPWALNSGARRECLQTTQPLPNANLQQEWQQAEARARGLEEAKRQSNQSNNPFS